MSRTYVARETALNRQVVVKVLSPDLAAGVSVDRFQREIQFAAALQHPHIVPVLSAGDTQGLPYYTMPFVAGESLRARLARGPLGITEALNVLKDVARALAFAHEQGVVHRDIKPDNVLLSGGSATVADFGIAKAISAARTATAGATLTQLGTSLGTPSYMAPEQAAGDPSMDHRADIYSFGVMAYEALAGQPPFHGLTPQRLLAAHMGERPRPIGELRPDAPAPLADLVMRCLEKDATLRPQSAADIARFLDTVTSGSAQGTAPAILLGGRGMLRKALLYYGAAFVAVAVLAKAAIVGIGLPDWVFPGALIVMALGLPMILATSYVHRVTRRALVATPTLTPGGSPAPAGTMATMALKAAPHLSWRRTAVGGVAAVGAFIALIAAWMIMRALGIGPAASLMAAGKLSERERIILADFKGADADSTLRYTVTDALRADLSQSQALNVMPANAVRETLRRMQRAPNLPIDFALAREVATREGIKAVIEGEVLALGGSYVLSARLVAAQTGEELASFSETAGAPKDIIPAISRLSKKLRTRAGESLRTIQSARTLDKVTTPSLEALQKYMAAIRAIDIEGDFTKAKELLEESIALDTGFAMAYRKLAVEMNNRGLDDKRVKEVIQKAYDHRDRLSDVERYLTIAGYYSYGPNPDRGRVTSAYESVIEHDPFNSTALNNLAIQYFVRKDYARAESLLVRGVAIQPSAIYFGNLTWAQLEQGKVREADATVQQALASPTRSPQIGIDVQAQVALAKGRLDDAIRLVDSVRVARPNDLSTQAYSQFVLADFATVRGKLAEAARLDAAARGARLQLGAKQAALNGELQNAFVDVWFRDQKAPAAAIIQRALREHPLDSLAPSDRPYPALARLYALLGQPERSRVMLAGYDSTKAGQDEDFFAGAEHRIRGDVAIAEKRYGDAITEYQQAETPGCIVCNLADLARAYDLAGRADSATAIFERYVSHPARSYGGDGPTLAGAHKRLAELYDAAGNRDKAISHYATFIELWKDADSELQPQVRKARERLQELQRGRG
jgi:tetratricopeptide (TPR) repeat protein/tRNA A-37 threonylcarbamoyl transferase component Bud32